MTGRFTPILLSFQKLSISTISGNGEMFTKIEFIFHKCIIIQFFGSLSRENTSSLLLDPCG
jgi:hypothetical protein